MACFWRGYFKTYVHKLKQLRLRHTFETSSFVNTRFNWLLTLYRHRPDRRWHAIDDAIDWLHIQCRFCRLGTLSNVVPNEILAQRFVLGCAGACGRYGGVLKCIDIYEEAVQRVIRKSHSSKKKMWKYILLRAKTKGHPFDHCYHWYARSEGIHRERQKIVGGKADTNYAPFL